MQVFPLIFLGIGVGAMLLWVLAWVRLVRRARRGVSNESLWWWAKSPAGGEMFARGPGRPHDVADYVPSYLLQAGAVGDLEDDESGPPRD